MDKEKKITENKYVKSFYCQDYFLWHSDDEFIEKYFLNKTNNYDLDDEDEEDTESEYDDDGENTTYWEILFDSYNDAKAGSKQKSESKIFDKIENKSRKFCEQIFKNKKIVEIDKSLSFDQKVEKTKEYMNSNDIDVIFKPTFSYVKDGFIVAETLYAIDKSTKSFYLFSPLPKTNILTLLKTDYAYNVLKKCGYDYRDIHVIIVENLLPLQKGEPKFYDTVICDMDKKGSTLDNKKFEEKRNTINLEGTPFYDNDHNFYTNYVRKGLQYSNEVEIKMSDKNENLKNKSFRYFDCIFYRFPLRKLTINTYDRKGNNKAVFSYTGAKKSIYNDECPLNDFDDNISRIIKAYTVDKPDFTIYSSNPKKDGKVLNLDSTNFKANEVFTKKYKLYLIGDEYRYNGSQNRCLSGDFAGKKGFESFEKLFEQYKNNIVASNAINDFFHKDLVEKYLSKLHVKGNKIVWYDYESFTSPLPIIDNMRPYRQTINQVSIIETINGEIIQDTQEDIVVDPLYIEVFDLIKILKNLYDRQGKWYIVYNKSFECPRNQEIANLARDCKKYDPNNFEKKLKDKLGISVSDVQKYADYINEHTIDLMDLFSRGHDITNLTDLFDINEKALKDPNINKVEYHLTRKNIPSDLDIKKAASSYGAEESFLSGILKQRIYLKDLHGLFSIKKIEKFITARDIKLEHKITPYPELENIHNGAEAMSAAILRYSGATGDNEWKHVESNLKKYCHNDVLAMIMAFNFAEYIVAGVFPEIMQTRYTFSEEEAYKINSNDWKIEVQPKESN
ncbi:DUF2779 domain-containing protein [Mycoplasmopsis adleri]|uniref:DUF2779 domain-containing protein n=1 Tax=Mycoplasmopsis adleri TaxID=51362 RepID=UPI0038730D85